jgi:Na+-translocating ferredoxin:NAD+ oxidoreductase RnfA subunit
MKAVHVALGFAVVGAFGLLWLWSLGTFVARRPDVHRWYWTLLAILQVILGIQVIVGIVLLVTGNRRPLLHYLYGAVFPLIVLIAAHVVARDEDNGFEPWKVFGFATFIAFGLTLRALMTGLGIG